MGVHELDFIAYVFGTAPRTVSCFATGSLTDITGTDFPAAMAVNMSFDDGGVGHYLTTQIDLLGMAGGRILLTDASMTYTWGEGIVKIKKRDGSEETIETATLKTEDPMTREIRLFADAVREGRPPEICAQDGLRACAMAEAAELSAQTHQTVKLPDDIVAPASE